MNNAKLRLNIVFASHSSMSGTFVVGSHHLARLISQQGHRVLHISTPITLLHIFAIQQSVIRARFRNWLIGGTRINKNLIDFVPFSLSRSRLAWRFAKFDNFLPVVPWSLKGVMRNFGMEEVDILFVDQPRMRGVEVLLNPEVIVYRATDVYPKIDQHSSVWRSERKFLEIADLVIGTSKPVIDHLAFELRAIKREEKSALLIENGVDYEHFAKPYAIPPEYRDISSPRAVYAGALDGRFDFLAIAQLARACPRLSIVLIGPWKPSDRKRVGEMSNVYWLGSRTYEELPAYLQHANVGLLPFSNHPANEGRSPMKLYEFAAAGLPIVSKGTKELHRRSHSYVMLYDTYDELVLAVSNYIEGEVVGKKYSELARESAKSREWRVIAEKIMEEAQLLLRTKKV